MKNTMIALGSLALLLGTGVTFTAQAQTPTPARMKRERHPEIMRALKTLMRARADMRKANNDFGGHKEKAIDLTDQAINQLKAALQADKN